MSTASHYAFLGRLHKELSVSSSDYRKLVVDTKWHSFVASHASIKKETLIEFKRRKIVPNSTELQQIEEAALKAYNNILKGVKQIIQDPKVSIDKRATYYNNKRLRLVFITYGERIEKVYRAQLDPSITFERIKILYRSAIGTYFKDLQTITGDAIRKLSANTKTGNFNKEQSASNFFNLGHLEGAGVSETQLRDSLAKAFESIPMESQGNYTDMLRTYGIDLSYQRIDSEDMMKVKIESAGDNKSRGGFSGAQKVNLLRSLKRALDSGLDPWLIEGSDTPKTRKKKQIRSKLLQPFKKIANSKVKVITGSDATVKDSSSKVAKLSSTGRTKKGSKKLVLGKLATVKVSNKATKSKVSFTNLLPLINARLPGKVADNMSSPALNNRTGTFASSVRAVNVTKTNKGFASIGYTYQKYPYQTFEPGYAQGDPQRDPRRLIDMSIREIAAELTLGRLYTRRL